MLQSILRRTGFVRQLTLIASIAMLGLSLCLSFMNSADMRHRLSAAYVEQTNCFIAGIAGVTLQDTTTAGELSERSRERLAASLRLPDFLRIEISDRNHRRMLLQEKPQAAELLGALTAESPVPASPSRAQLLQENSEAWLFAAPIVGPSTAEGAGGAARPQVLGYVQLLASKATLNRSVRTLLLINLGISLSITVLMLLLLRWTVRRAMAPLHELSSLMQRAEHGDSSLRAEPLGSREIADMALAFNRMMEVLDERGLALRQSHEDAMHNARLTSRFATSVSHEVRTPLNGLVGMLDLLRETQLTKRQQECVDIAWSSSQALIELIDDILDFSKLEAGKLELEEIEFDLRQLVEDILTLLAKQAQQKNLALGYLMDAEVPDRISGDSLRLRQVLLNLLGNAIKFTERGEVALRISCIGDAVAVAADGDASPFGLRFEVSDTGIGMTEEAVEHAFESFVQAERSTTRRFGGTGLGLPICRQLVQLMSGEIGIVSERARGTLLWFTIRCKTGMPSMTARPAPALQGHHAMLIGGPGIVRDFLFYHLSEQGMQCTYAATHADAVQELMRVDTDAHAYQLLVMEIDQIGSAGADLVRNLRAGGSAKAPRLLLLDRYGSVIDEAAIEHEAILEKPLRRDPLQQAVSRLLAAAPLPMPPLPEPYTPSGKALHVLVAEDNHTNRMVAAGMLAANGCHCEFAANGIEAVTAVRTQHFDLILMDCNMPQMDGYEATMHIRSLELGTGRHTPIVAMTANTQRGAAEKCLSSGMDDYLAKPITLTELRRKLNHWRPLDSSTAPAAAEEPLDMVVFGKLRVVLGTALPQALKPFLEDMQTYLATLAQAVEQRDANAARDQAHAIKGSSGNLGAVQMARLAKQIEDLARVPALDQVAALLAPLHQAFEAVAAILSDEMALADTDQADKVKEHPHVLIVEDDRSTRSALRHTLQREGFRVDEAEDGAQALTILKRLQPDVILMDAMMPVMDGFAACARLQEMPNGRTIPVLMITALDDNLSVERAFAAGASDYIAKPIHFAVLSQRVRRIIDASRAEKRLRHLTNNDLLTGLPNRVMFVDYLDLALVQAHKETETLAVLFLDLDRFKNVNDTLGRDIGDRLLVAVGQRLLRMVRSADCVARLGGDEFGIMMADIDAAHAAGAAQNICRALATPFEIDGHDIFVTASVGISMYPNDGAEVDVLLKHADTAMYRAKKSTTGLQFFEASMEQSISERMRLENDLRHALERGELDVYYQPQVRLESGRVVGMEALVRWHHPVRGMVAPIEFIPLAEETGLIIPLGVWVLRTACAQVQRWVANGAQELRVAVNLSVRQLLQKDFTEAVEDVLRQTALAPHLLELEITESTLMENADDTLAALNRLRALGIRLSIDDFGTGYSSLAYLKRFPVDVIKIDRSFVRDVCESADDAAIVAGIIVLAHSLRLEVVAEGVETAAQLAFLREKSCDLMQGYYLSPAVPAEQFTRFIETGAPLTAAASTAVFRPDA